MNEKPTARNPLVDYIEAAAKLFADVRFGEAIQSAENTMRQFNLAEQPSPKPPTKEANE